MPPSSSKPFVQDKGDIYTIVIIVIIIVVKCMYQSSGVGTSLPHYLFLAHKSFAHGVSKEFLVVEVVVRVTDVDALAAACRSYMGAVVLFFRRCIRQQICSLSPREYGTRD